MLGKLVIVLGIVLVIVGVYTWRGPEAFTGDLLRIATSTSEIIPSANDVLPGKSPAATDAPTGPKRTFENGVYVTTIYYTRNGFDPSKLELKAGEEVRFVNSTTLTMRIVADDTLSNQYYASFNQPQSVGRGGSYQLALPQPGILTYYNLNSNPRQGGQIFVK